MSIDVETKKLERMIQSSILAPDGLMQDLAPQQAPLPAFPYADLWGERSILSVANLTRSDGLEFLPLAARLGIRTETRSFPLAEANEALELLRSGSIEGAAMLVP